MSCIVRKPGFGIPTGSDTNGAVQPQRRVRGLKFRTYGVERLYCVCSKNKGADQLLGNCCTFVYAYTKSKFSHDAAHIFCFNEYICCE